MRTESIAGTGDAGPEEVREELIFLGIIVAALAVTGAVAAVTDGANHHTAVTLSEFGKTLPVTSAAGVFLIGAATASVFLLGCSIAVSGFRRGARVRRELRDLRDEHDENLQVLAAEKAELQRQLARERRLGGHGQTMSGHSFPGGSSSAPPYPGTETSPISSGHATQSGAFPGADMPQGGPTAQLFRRRGR